MAFYRNQSGQQPLPEKGLIEFLGLFLHLLHCFLLLQIVFEKYYQNKGVSSPFFKHAPKSKEARKEYFSRKLHELGRMEAQYQLMSLLANTGTWATNIFSGSAMTIGSAGIKNFADTYSNKKIYDMLQSPIVR